MRENPCCSMDMDLWRPLQIQPTMHAGTPYRLRLRIAVFEFSFSGRKEKIHLPHTEHQRVFFLFLSPTNEHITTTRKGAPLMKSPKCCCPMTSKDLSCCPWRVKFLSHKPAWHVSAQKWSFSFFLGFPTSSFRIQIGSSQAH